MHYFKPTIVFIVGSVAAVTIYDVWAVAGGYERTISATLLQAAKDWPIIPFALGVLSGHLFFPNRAAAAPGEVTK
jgi:hypothetical protein